MTITERCPWLASQGGDARTLAARLPPELGPLATLAYNYWWSWQVDGAEIFRGIDPARWEACHENPVHLLKQASPLCLERAAKDASLVSRATAMADALSAELARPFAEVPPATPERPIAFLCAEFGVHVSLPIYGGGLGALAGDFLKEASDRALPLVGVGLFYRRGYFHQRLDSNGAQHEYWTREWPDQLPLSVVHDAAGAPLVVRVSVRDHDVEAQVLRAMIGRVPLFLLDTELPANSPVDRWISAQLYVGEREYRLMQYELLGVGAVRALDALGIDPAIVHLNEGHPALAASEMARQGVARGLSPDRALAQTRARTVFTTHTPVAAGNETYAQDEAERIVGKGVGPVDPLTLGASTRVPYRPFAMTELALRMSRSVNGVSARHGEVARAMWRHMYPSGADVPITHVTNGVHLPSWMSAPMRALLTRRLGEGFEARASDPATWAAIDDIPDEEIWAVRNELRARLVEFVRARSVADRLARGEPLEYVEAAAKRFDPNVLTVGFARRVASYKRLHLLTHDAARALALLRSERPIQVLLAGKAHPRDDQAKQIIQKIFVIKSAPEVGARVAYLEDHDLSMAAILVAGCDVWVNLPRPPLEASGTSGMKAALNGGLALSVLDGWWSEAFDGTNGWAIQSEGGIEEAAQDARDADRLYGILEREAVPSFHDRDASGIPRGWIRRIKASMKSIAPRFCASRMMADYEKRIYLTSR